MTPQIATTASAKGCGLCSMLPKKWAARKRERCRFNKMVMTNIDFILEMAQYHAANRSGTRHGARATGDGIKIQTLIRQMRGHHVSGNDGIHPPILVPPLHSASTS
jgi:hypothetical protein